MRDVSVVASSVMCDGSWCRASTFSWLRIPQTYQPHGCVDLVSTCRSRLAFIVPLRATLLRLTFSLRTSYLIPSVLPRDEVIALL